MTSGLLANRTARRRGIAYVVLLSVSMLAMAASATAPVKELQKAFGFAPGFSTRVALEDFIRGRRIRQVLPRETVEQWERDLYSFLRRRGAERLEEVTT